MLRPIEAREVTGESTPLRIAYLTAGAAGMFCGSCMHDNTLARALTKLGCDVQLVPLYTPIRTDETAVTSDRVFLGGINVYLEQKSALFRSLPRWMTAWLDAPWLIRFATGLGIETKATELGALAVSVLKGDHGFQRQEVERLAKWIAGEQSDVVVFSNVLTAGSARAIKQRRDTTIVVTLQGDDIFLRDLPEPHRSQAFAEIRELLSDIDGFLVNSEYYADFMAEYLTAPRDKFEVVPLGIDVTDFAGLPLSSSNADHRPTIGYLARLAPEKGLHVLADAFVELHQQRPELQARLHVAGWLGAHNRAYANEQFQKIEKAGLSEYFRHVGEVDRLGKLQFLQEIDILSVPTTYRDPKGLFVLEALAAGVPVVQPEHGAFPELLHGTGGGVLFPPGDPVALARALGDLLTDNARRKTFGEQGRAAVHASFNAPAMARHTLAALSRIRERAAARLTQSSSSAPLTGSR
jgi:glycosyltransferase involved in cell wall biosynthesis